jgi:competence/damage-inducible protein CinA-like protein
MPSAEIITIGTEILLGEIVDTNSRHVARELRDIGVDLFRKSTVGDNAQRIAQVIRDSMKRCEIIITTGGLGPTVDDPTREAAALAVDVDLEFRAELWEQIKARYRRFGRSPTENNRRQAYVPRGAVAVENPVGTAPAFIVETDRNSIICLPGVPREMEYLMAQAVIPYLYGRYQLEGIIKSRIIHTAGAGESQIDELIGDLEELSNPTVGMAAHSGQVDIRITAKAGSSQEADQLILPVEAEVRSRLKDWVYGADEQSLESVALLNLRDKGWSIVVVESGLGGELTARLAEDEVVYRGGEVLKHVPERDDLVALVRGYRSTRKVEVGLGVVIYPGSEKQDVYIVILTPHRTEQVTRPYGGPPGNAPRWAVHHCLDLLRKL